MPDCIQLIKKGGDKDTKVPCVQLFLKNQGIVRSPACIQLGLGAICNCVVPPLSDFDIAFCKSDFSYAETSHPTDDITIKSYRNGDLDFLTYTSPFPGEGNSVTLRVEKEPQNPPVKDYELILKAEGLNQSEPPVGNIYMEVFCNNSSSDGFSYEFETNEFINDYNNVLNIKVLFDKNNKVLYVEDEVSNSLYPNRLFTKTECLDSGYKIYTAIIDDTTDPDCVFVQYIEKI